MPNKAPAHGHRLPLLWGGLVVGSVAADVAEALCAQSTAVPACCLQKIQQHNQPGYALEPFSTGDFTMHMARLAHALRACGRSGPWRDELLPVADGSGQTLGLVERGVVRVLGLRTQAVNLVGLRPDGAVLVQQRSLAKPNDPGLWDTLMGGTVAGNETVAETLERETWEEAGLHLAALSNVIHHGHFTATRPVPDGGGAGLLVEDTHWYTALVPLGLEPVNQDGEVDHFECWAPARVREAVAQGLFTDEAAWVLQRVLGG